MRIPGLCADFGMNKTKLTNGHAPLYHLDGKLVIVIALDKNNCIVPVASA